jgi:hypothetical protein
MSTRYNNGWHYENHQQSAELHDGAAHAHRDRQTPATVGHGIAAFGHADIAALAYEHWQARGCPHGSAQEDWFHAAEELRSRTYAR